MRMMKPLDTDYVWFETIQRKRDNVSECADYSIDSNLNMCNEAW